ncbi:unnamed protein product [Spirodela intermedia]|uniref:UDP N-acetylglucosamine O-acyltransferase C-terminal domain-containing protein n=1 Tax=Spirodela intermedia TaxID=51605 RepID=A0A7I8J780_SPIIN|nr:unnamed protein product [Spirodela intermedia]CAA6666086.1 unnamed protein product [Spirodela intermedia]
MSAMVTTSERLTRAPGNDDIVRETESMIHPTAVIHSGAVIGQGVLVAAFCTIGSAVKVGDHCQLHPGSHIFGDTELGNNYKTQFGHHAVVGTKCQDLKYTTGDECFLHIGDNNDIREYASIHRSSKFTDKTVIGNNNLIMGSCHIAHDCKVGNNNIFSNNSLFAGHVEVEDYVRTSGASVVHQFCHLGSHCFISGGSVVTQDVPRFMMVSGDRAEIRGLNLEGLRRRGFSSFEIRGMKRAYRKIFMPSEQSSSLIEQRLAEVEQDEELAAFPAVRSMVKSIRGSFQTDRRGICHFRNCWLLNETLSEFPIIFISYRIRFLGDSTVSDILPNQEPSGSSNRHIFIWVDSY